MTPTNHHPVDRVSRELLARVWKAGAGPGDAPFTIDLDSTICETYGLAKEGARHHGYTGARGYHPLPAVAAGLPRAKRIHVLTMLVEGSSMRSRVLRSPALLASSARIGANGGRGSIQNPPHRGHAAQTRGATVCGGILVGVRGWKGLYGPLTEGRPASAGASRRGIGRDRRSGAISKLPSAGASSPRRRPGAAVDLRGVPGPSLRSTSSGPRSSPAPGRSAAAGSRTAADLGSDAERDRGT